VGYGKVFISLNRYAVSLAVGGFLSNAVVKCYMSTASNFFYTYITITSGVAKNRS